MATLWSVAQPVIIVSYYCDEILSFFVNAFLNARKDQIEKVATLKCYGVYFYGLQYELKIGKTALIYSQGFFEMFFVNRLIDSRNKRRLFESVMH